MFRESVSSVNQSEPELHQALKNAASLARYLEKNASSADAADIFQESIARVLEQARQKPVLNPLAYAFTVARHMLMRLKPLPAEQPDELACQSANPEEMASMQQTVALFSQALAAMPALRRQVFVLYRMEGKSRSCIATLLQISEEAVSKHVSRALADIQRQIDQQRAG
ncbi:RNA polymerase sigma factor [Rheinheimera oceanensis]|uniref:RNA polymerase sigma factor n=1 Tax=Rheinheimera oceanensis TaxID=2817449 RepID=UPI001BFEC066|nr:sigma-70 family RNA polymerase sigma factor [Rheinheimera oceanensis]